jgi:mevalonate kinase
MHFHANGKLLLTGEYVVLDGAKALALPTLPGQSLQVQANGPTGHLRWISKGHEGAVWFEATFRTHDWEAISSSDPQISNRLQQILTVLTNSRPDFPEAAAGKTVETRLEFPRAWGLGTSSTLIYMLAQWADTDPWTLLDATFGGSGYDLAAAQAEGPFVYRIDGTPRAEAVRFGPPFTDQLFFVYLERKQNSREGIAHYRARAAQAQAVIPRINEITEALLQTTTLQQFEQLLQEHETILSTLLDLPRMQEVQFSDFPGCIKSLGAWGGDFVLATSGGMSPPELTDWFRQRNYSTILPYAKLIRQRES